MSSGMKNSMSFTGGNQQINSKQSLEEKKALLKKQIKELKCLKDKIQQTLNTSTRIIENDKNSFSQAYDVSTSQITKLASSLPIKYELFDYAGIKCVKYSKDEFIFHFVVKGDETKSHVYFVQFFNIDDKGELGKWVLPTFIDIKWILKDTPLENLRNAFKFVRNCKHYIDCYHNRMDQFVTLKKSLETITNCTLDADRSYKYINIDLFGVHDVEFNRYLNIIVYLVYDLKEARPQRITIDTQHGACLENETEIALKSYLTAFRKFSLKEAFEYIENGDNALFSWKRLEKDETVLDIQDSEYESSESEYLPRQNRKRKNNTRENKLKQKNKRKKRTKRKITATSGRESEVEIEHIKKTKSKFRDDNEEMPLVQKVSSPKRKRLMKTKPKEMDISRFLAKKDKDRTESEPKNSNESVNEEPAEKTSLKVLPSSEEKSTESLKQTIKPSIVKLTPLDLNIEVMNKLRPQENLVLEKISEHETSKEERVSKSTRNSAKKNVEPKKISHNRVSPRSKPISPTKIKKRKKKEKVFKIRTSPRCAQSNLKQTNLEIHHPDENSPSTETTKIKLRSQEKLLKFKYVTSTPMPFNRKIKGRRPEDDLDISEIKSNKKLPNEK